MTDGLNYGNSKLLVRHSGHGLKKNLCITRHLNSKQLRPDKYNKMLIIRMLIIQIPTLVLAKRDSNFKLI